MSVLEKITIGIVGVCGGVGRGAGIAGVMKSVPPLQVKAICDIDAAKLEEVRAKLDVPEAYTDYDEMLDKADLDAVFIATPMDLHVPQSVAALEKNISVLCEVTAAVNVDECKQLVAACNASEAVYLMAENYNYNPPVAAVREMVLQGLFGETYYAEGGYIAEIKSLVDVTPWRRKWQLGINGITYIAHNLGPMLEWMPGQRVVSVCCSGSGHRYNDPDGKPFEAEAGCTMLGKTTNGGQVLIRSDFLSNRPGIGVYNNLQGTEGCYESTGNHVWLKGRSDGMQWTDLDEIIDEYLPEYMKEAGEGWGCDHFQAQWLVDAMAGKRPIRNGIHESMDITLPGLISQLSIEDGGKWMDVPDSREW